MAIICYGANIAACWLKHAAFEKKEKNKKKKVNVFTAISRDKKHVCLMFYSMYTVAVWITLFINSACKAEETFVLYKLKWK